MAIRDHIPGAAGATSAGAALVDIVLNSGDAIMALMLILFQQPELFVSFLSTVEGAMSRVPGLDEQLVSYMVTIALAILALNYLRKIIKRVRKNDDD